MSDARSPRASLMAHRSSLIAHRSSLIAHRASLTAQGSGLIANDLEIIMVIKPVNLPFLLRRKRVQVGAPTPPPAALTLVAASYDPDTGPTLTLVFDRAINFDNFDGDQIIVNDNESLQLRFRAAGEFTVSPANTIAIQLQELGEPQGTGDTLDASADTGLVAADDGAPWAGASDLELPFS
ncbi:hypothetical protein BH09PLA1_BH09PLA1_36400 [soil metagenome]